MFLVVKTRKKDRINNLKRDGNLEIQKERKEDKVIYVARDSICGVHVSCRSQSFKITFVIISKGQCMPQLDTTKNSQSSIVDHGLIWVDCYHQANVNTFFFPPD